MFYKSHGYKDCKMQVIGLISLFLARMLKLYGEYLLYHSDDVILPHEIGVHFR